MKDGLQSLRGSLRLGAYERWITVVARQLRIQPLCEMDARSVGGHNKMIPAIGHHNGFSCSSCFVLPVFAGHSLTRARSCANKKKQKNPRGYEATAGPPPHNAKVILLMVFPLRPSLNSGATGAQCESQIPYVFFYEAFAQWRGQG